MNNSITIDIEPIGKPRMTQRDKWHKRPITQRYWDYKAYMNLIAQRYRFKPSNQLLMHFYVPMPISWSKKKRGDMLGRPHQSKPDIDNFIKGVLDAFFEDDSKVYEVWGRKMWGDKGCIVIKNLPL